MDRIEQILNKICRSRYSKWVYISIFVVWAIYVVLTFGTPIEDADRLGLSGPEIFFIRLTIAIPYLLIWLAAAYSFVRIIGYSRTISGSRESRAFYYLGLGVLVLLAALVLSSVSSAANNFVEEESSLHKTIAITDNYLYVFPYLVSFWLILLASRYLLRRLKQDVTIRTLIFFGTALAVFSYIWLDLIFTNPTRSVGTPDTPPTYYMRDSLIILTIVIPSIAAWVVGIWSVLGLNRYREKVKGIIYRQAFSALAIGVSAVIITSIFLQGLLSLGTERLLDLGLGQLLGLIYLFVLIQGIGFVFIALGTKRLTKIEKV